MPHTPHCSPEQNRLILEEVKELLQKGEVSVVTSPRTGFYSNLFLVSKKDGGQRSVINLKSLNQFVRTQHFNIEGIYTLNEIVRPNDWMVKVDLKDAFFTTLIHNTHKQYLKFMFREKGYQFNCLPFGLSSAPWVFTKTLKPAIALLRE